MKEYYDILGLNEGAKEEDIKKAYRKMSKKYHPDLNPNNKEAEENFKKVVQAYEILTGKQKPKRQENPFGGFSPFQGGPQKARPLKLVIELTLEESYYGCDKIINFHSTEACDKCHGEGGFEPQKCNQCGGNGHIQQGPFLFMCNNCGGNGKLFKSVCYHCNGNGAVKTIRSVEVKVPSGTVDDSFFTYPNLGDWVKNAQRGDLYFITKLKPHDVYTLEGLNLKRKLDIPILDILLGVESEFGTLDGSVKVKIPKLSETNKTFRLRGKGFVDGSTGISGDLYVTLNPIIPKELSDIEEYKIRELKNMPNFS